MNIKELIVRFKVKLLEFKDKLSIELDKINTRVKYIGQLRNIFGSRAKDLYEILLEVPTEDLFEYVKFANVDFTLEDINKFKYILSEDIFKGTYRYKEAKDSFEALGSALRNESLKRIPSEHLEDCKNRLTIIEQLIAVIKDGKIIGPVENIVDVMELFEFNPLSEFTEEEKKAIIKELVISDLGFLRKASEELENRAIRRQEDIINESDEVVIVDDLEPVDEEGLETTEETHEEEKPTEVTEEIPDYLGIETRKQEDIPRVGKYRTVVDLEKENVLNSIGFYAEKALDKFPPKSATHEEYFHNLAEKLLSKQIDLEILRSVLIIDKQFAYVLAVYLRNLVVALNEFLDTEDEIDVEVINELYEEQMASITNVYELLKKMIEKIELSYQTTDTVEQSENEEDNKFKIVFVKNGIESYFSKSLFELRAYENIGNIEKILVELESGLFSGDHKVGDFKYKTKGSFAIFYKVKNGHIFVFNVILARDLASKKTDNILSMIGYEDELNAVLEKGPEYRQLMEDSNREREELRVMLGVALNEPQL